MNIKKLIGTGIIMVLGFVSNVFAVTLRTVRKTKNTADYNRTSINGDYSILDMISLVNNYLWFSIGFVCFLFMIINGYKLITANGDEKQTKTATSALIKSVIGIAICLLAYIIVNLAVKIFA